MAAPRVAAALALCAIFTQAAGCKPEPLVCLDCPVGTCVDGVCVPPPVLYAVRPAPVTQADVLFMVDNSYSMDPMQSSLRRDLPAFFAPFEELAKAGTASDLHLGVVTSDFGAGATGAPGCTPGGQGDRGALIAIGKKADAKCRRPVGGDFVEYRFGADPPSSNLPGDQDLITTLQCMMSVGSFGCGFEHQLESVHQALVERTTAGFLRPNALLAVVFFTNEDDGSAPPDTDIFDRNKVAQYGYLDSYSRQTRFAVQCCPPGKTECKDEEQTFPPYADSKGPLSGCVPSASAFGDFPGKQYDLERYRTWLAPNNDPMSVVLAAIDAPETPFQVILSNPGTPAGVPYGDCGALNESGNPPCVPVVQHSCSGPDAHFGDPSVRINTLVREAPIHHVASICDSSYEAALRRIGGLVAGAFAGGCVTDALSLDLATAVSRCQVGVARGWSSGASDWLPHCGPDTAAGVACWRLAPDPRCTGASPDGVMLTVENQKLTAGDWLQMACPAKS